MSAGVEDNNHAETRMDTSMDLKENNGISTTTTNAVTNNAAPESQDAQNSQSTVDDGNETTALLIPLISW